MCEIVCIAECYEGVYYHIGVGSYVVCFNMIGNGRASIRGTGSRIVPRFFCASIANPLLTSREKRPCNILCNYEKCISLENAVRGYGSNTGHGIVILQQ